METKTDISYGVIPITQVHGVWSVFLIHQFGSAGDEYWTFPKGHPEAGETNIQSATRELFEETGLIPQELLTDNTYEQTYSFQYEGMRIDKKVVFYVGIVTASAFVIQEKEIKEAGWFTFRDAYERLTYDRSKAILRDVESAVVHRV